MTVELRTFTNPNVLLEKTYGASVVLSTPGIAMENVGSIAKLYNRDVYLTPTKEAETRLEFARITDTLSLETTEVVVPTTMLEYKHTAAQYQKQSELGVLGKAEMILADAIATKLDKWFFQGPNSTSEAALSGLIYGLMDTSNTDGSTLLKAKTCDGGSTAGKWDSAGNAQKDILAVKAALRAKGFDGPIALLYPISASKAFEHELLSGASVYADKSILQYAKEQFDYVIPIKNDKDGSCVLTGNTETEEDFQICAVALNYWKVVYTRDITINWLHDEVEDEYILRGVANMSLVPIVQKVGDYYYKGMSEIDSIDLTT